MTMKTNYKYFIRYITDCETTLYDSFQINSSCQDLRANSPIPSGQTSVRFDNDHQLGPVPLRWSSRIVPAESVTCEK